MRRHAFLVALLSFFLLLGDRPSTADDAPAATEGKPAPELSVSGWKNSKELKLADLKGKVVVLKFWATWCAPCKSTLPKFNKLSESESLKDKVVLIGVHDKKDCATMPAFLERNKFGFIGCQDDKGDTAKAYGVKQLPFNVIIDKKGNVKKLDAELDEKELAKLAGE
jgi:thiol-disulfide isomerase/thioredoxin